MQFQCALSVALLEISGMLFAYKCCILLIMDAVHNYGFVKQTLWMIAKVLLSIAQYFCLSPSFTLKTVAILEFSKHVHKEITFEIQITL